MSLNFSLGQPICAVVDEGKMTNKIVYVDNNDDGEEYVKSFDAFTLKRGTFQLIPNKTTERNTCLTVIGPNGVGKSYFIGKYIQVYHKMYPKQKIYLISEKTEDESLDFPYVKRVKVDESLIENPLTLDEFKEVGPCLVIADDIDSLTGKVKKSVYETINKCLKVGRSYGINMIITLHNYNGLETRHILNECQAITFFAQNWNANLEHLTSKYMGLSKQEVKIIRQNKSRATTYVKSYPNIIVQERNIFVLGKNI